MLYICSKKSLREEKYITTEEAKAQSPDKIQSRIQEREYEQLEYFLNQFNSLLIKKIFPFIDDATGKFFPPEILNIIGSYDDLLSRVGFFSFRPVEIPSIAYTDTSNKFLNFDDRNLDVVPASKPSM